MTFCTWDDFIASEYSTVMAENEEEKKQKSLKWYPDQKVLTPQNWQFLLFYGLTKVWSMKFYNSFKIFEFA